MDHDSPEGHVAQDSSAYDGLIGKTIANNFRIVRRIGAGAMGRVYEAEQLSLGKMVALKILRHELMADEKILGRFQFEARAASAASHPNLIQIIDCGRDATLGLAYIGMELLSGTDLSQVIHTQWPIPLQRTARIIDQVLAGLEEAHSKGIIHRDLKPGNIMLVSHRNEHDVVKVCDFGIAKAQSNPHQPNLTMVGVVFGTPEYMSPEQARGAAVDARTDLYAVATILYELVVGNVPFPAGSPSEVMARVLRDQPVPPTKSGHIHLPEALESLMMRGLAKRPEHRPQSAAQFREEFRDALFGIVDPWPGSTGGLPAQGPPTLPAVSIDRSPRSLYASAPPRPVTVRGSAAPTQAQGLRPASPVWIWVVGGGVALALALLVTKTDWRTRMGALLGTPSATTGPAEPRGASPPFPSADPSRPPAAEPPLAGPSARRPPAGAAEIPTAVTPVDDTAIGAEVHQVAEQPPELAGKRSAGARSRVVSRPGKRAVTPDRGNPPPLRRESEPAPSRALEPSQPVTTPAPMDDPPPAVAVRASAPAAGGGGSAGELMREAERLLGEGEVSPACIKGEESRRANPASPMVYKFLGKCYMRAGKPKPASDNYRRYLELSPNAPDAAFIRSYVR